MIEALHNQQARHVGTVFGNVAESRGHAALEVVDRLEEVLEFIGFVHLDFPVLGALAVKQVIQLHRLVGRRALLICGGPESKPEEDVPHQAVLRLLRVEDDVAVALVEVAVLRLGPGDHLELLDAPDLHAWGHAATLPSLLCLSRLLAKRLVLVRADAGEVRVLDLQLAEFKSVSHGDGLGVPQHGWGRPSGVQPSLGQTRGTMA
mmetsp:Transcript_102250/g.324876  ORF Transcript_102250/g.324876 Transcript_102250/m.324876 type:complete len:205 (-) Transcript_102250:7-621(-)